MSVILCQAVLGINELIGKTYHVTRHIASLSDCTLSLSGTEFIDPYVFVHLLYELWYETLIPTT